MNTNNKQCKCNKSKVVNDLLKRISNLEFDVEDKQREIERLNNRVKRLEKSIMISNKKHSFMTKDNIKLRTIINELEKDLEEKIDEDRLNILSNSHWKYVLDKLQELKGSNSNENL